MKNTFPFTHDDDPMKSWHYHYFPGDVTWFHNGSPSKILTRGLGATKEGKSLGMNVC